MDITPVTQFKGWTAKREDLAAFTGADYPSGSKVRQYLEMAKLSPNVPMIVGCSAHSAMQIYIAAAAQQAGVRGIVFTAARKERTEATKYAASLGTEIVEVRPAYLSVCRSRARDRATQLGKVVRWDPGMALHDTEKQCQNIPAKTKRVVVPTGSGLTCSGVLAGLAQYGKRATVLAVAVSDLATKADILKKARDMLPAKPRLKLPALEFVRAPGAYADWVAAKLPDGTVMDPYYAAKALAYVRPGDCLWLPGLRPLSAMPPACVKALDAIV